MDHPFLRATLVLLTSGLCYGAGVTIDLIGGEAGGSVTFTTTLNPPAKPYVVVSWSVNSTSFITSTTTNIITAPGYEDRITLHRSTGSLELRNLTRNDTGVYILSIIPVGELEITGSTMLEVFPKLPTPTLSCPTTNLIEHKGSIIMTCDADGFISNREWMKDGRPLTSDDRIIFSEGNRVLSISPLNRVDSGEYLCNVSHPVSFETAKCCITVNYGPDNSTIIQEPVSATLEKKVSLTCSADSVPKATFTWKFDGVKTDGPVYNIQDLDEDHLGNYICTASNAVTGLEVSMAHTLNGSPPAPLTGSMSMMVTSALALLGLMLV